MTDGEQNPKLLKQMTNRIYKPKKKLAAIEDNKEETAEKATKVQKGGKTFNIKKMMPKKVYDNLPSGKTTLDATLFAGTCFLIYSYGSKLAEALEGLVPSEKAIIEMMNQQQPQMPPPY